MKTAVHFQNVLKNFRGFPVLRIDDLRLYERESVAFYGLPLEYSEILTNLMTGVSDPDEGSVEILGLKSDQMDDEQSWFDLFQKIGIYSSQHWFQQGVSIGENVAAFFRHRNEAIEEPQLSAAVLSLSNLVHLSITDLSKMMAEATPVLQMKLRLARALAYLPEVVILVEPTLDMAEDVSRQFTDLLRRTRRKLHYTSIFFTSDVNLMEQMVDRVVFLDPST